MLIILLTIPLAISLATNLILFLELRRKKKRPQTQELQEFLVDLMSGYGVIAVGRIDPSSLLMRSPKQK